MSITASSVYVSLATAIVIGSVGSLCIILLEKLLEQCKIDDPVGAIPVHLGCGIWGTLAAGLFANQLPTYIDNPLIRIEQIWAQIMGILVVNLTIMILSLIFWLFIGLTIYGLENLNQVLQASTQQFEPSNQNSLSIANQQFKYDGFYKYLHLARKSLRVSQAEESEGSDGTFS